MVIKSIDLLDDEECVGAVFGLDPPGRLTVLVRRDSGAIWRNRKSEGEASIMFVVRPGERRVFSDELASFADELSRKEFLGVGAEQQLLFSGGIQVQPAALLEPRDTLDNSRDLVSYASTVAIPGVATSEPETQEPGKG